MAVHAVSIRRLADALDGKVELAPWSTVDMVGTFARPDLLVDQTAMRVHGRDFPIAQSVLVFAPIGVTWLGLVLATSAYQDMISTPEGARAAAGRSFLELWQEGFGGHLAGAFTFGRLALYTLAALVGIVVMMVLGARRARTAESEAAESLRDFTGELVPALVAAQVMAAAAQQASPARFTAELAKAGDRLATLLGKATAAQDGLGGVVTQIDALMRELSSSVASVTVAATDLSRGSDAVKAAIDAARETTQALERTVTTHVRTGVETISTATAEATEHSEALSAAGRRLLEEIGDRARDQLDSSAQRQSEFLEEVAATVDSAVAALRSSTDRLGEAGGGLSRSLGEAGREGAEAIAQTYQDAVAAAATSLGREMVRIGGSLADQVEELRAVTERHESQTRAVMGVHTAAVSELVGTVHDLQTITEKYGEATSRTVEEQARLTVQGNANAAEQLSSALREFEQSIRDVAGQHREVVRGLADSEAQRVGADADRTRGIAELASSIQDLREAVTVRATSNGGGSHAAGARGRAANRPRRRARSARSTGTQ